MLQSAQFAESLVETASDVSAAESDKLPLLLLSSMSFCVASAASCTSLSSSETETKVSGWEPNLFRSVKRGKS